MVRNPPCNAGDMDSIPGKGIKILHVSGQLSLGAATKPACSAACVPSWREAHRLQLNHGATEILRATTETPCHKINKYFLKRNQV